MCPGGALCHGTRPVRRLGDTSQRSSVITPFSTAARSIALTPLSPVKVGTAWQISQ
jgi:hypothetical protein